MRHSISPVLPAVEYIKQHYTEEFDVAMLRGMCYLSEAQFFSLFKKAVGMSPVQYKNFLRVERAKELLLEGRHLEREIAAMLGFRNLNYFCIVFKARTGVTPLNYQRAHT